MSIRASSLLLLENCLFLPCLADRKWGRASFKRRYAEADWYQRYDSELSSQLKIKSDDSILAVIVIVIKHYFYRSDRKAHDYEFYTRVFTSSRKYISILALFLSSFRRFLYHEHPRPPNRKSYNPYSSILFFPFQLEGLLLWNRYRGRGEAWNHWLRRGKNASGTRDEDGCSGIIRMGRGPRGVNAEQLRSA